MSFWASWCGPCREYNPDWISLYNRYKEKGLEIIGVSFDTSREAWKKAIVQDKISWQQISDLISLDESENSIRFSIRSIPSNYLLDKDGRILAIDITPKRLAGILKEKIGQ